MGDLLGTSTTETEAKGTSIMEDEVMTRKSPNRLASSKGRLRLSDVEELWASPPF